jgi:predicted peptidase
MLEQFENQQTEMINHLIDLTNEAAQVWAFHSENPNYVDPVQYHSILVKKIKDLENQITLSNLDNGVL